MNLKNRIAQAKELADEHGEHEWGEFLAARVALIHRRHKDGKSDAEIAEEVSANTAQIKGIREATTI